MARDSSRIPDLIQCATKSSKVAGSIPAVASGWKQNARGPFTARWTWKDINLAEISGALSYEVYHNHIVVSAHETPDTVETRRYVLAQYDFPASTLAIAKTKPVLIVRLFSALFFFFALSTRFCIINIITVVLLLYFILMSLVLYGDYWGRGRYLILPFFFFTSRIVKFLLNVTSTAV